MDVTWTVQILFILSSAGLQHSATRVYCSRSTVNSFLFPILLQSSLQASFSSFPGPKFNFIVIVETQSSGHLCITLYYLTQRNRFSVWHFVRGLMSFYGNVLSASCLVSKPENLRLFIVSADLHILRTTRQCTTLRTQQCAYKILIWNEIDQWDALAFDYVETRS